LHDPVLRVSHHERHVAEQHGHAWWSGCSGGLLKLRQGGQLGGGLLLGSACSGSLSRAIPCFVTGARRWIMRRLKMLGGHRGL
jgi:hypothetical protein